MTELKFTIIEDLDTSRLLFLDTSDYSVAPVSPTLHIKFPDIKKIYSTPIQYGQINILNTKRIGWSESITEFPDGVYQLEFEIDNKRCSVSTAYFRTTKAWNMLDNALNTKDYNKDLLEKFNKINLYLKGAESTVKTDGFQAQQLYKQAIDLLNCFPNVRMLKNNKCSSCS